MISLPNGCKCSNPSVFPKNWETGQHDLSIDWYITYRFYDPAHPRPKLVSIRGMNDYHTIADRRRATRTILNYHLDLLQTGYNPITKARIEAPDHEISPDTPFIIAYRKALERLTITPRVKIGINSVIKGVEKSAEEMNIKNMPIGQVSRRHIKMILERCAKNSVKWSNNRFNTYRGYLMMLYKELVELEAVQHNPIRDISKKTVVKKIKATLSNKQRAYIDSHLKTSFPRFREFVHLFFHSGGRKTELLQLKPPMVDLAAQKYRCIIKKGKQYKEVERTIKTIAIPYWKFFLEGCPADKFIFGTLFQPGVKPMGEETPTRYWKRFIKDDIDKGGLGIDIDFYSLKHLNTTEVVDRLDEQAAAALNAHTSKAMVVNIYDVRQRDRQHNRLKEVNNPFT